MMKTTAWMGAGLLALPLHLAWANGDRPLSDTATPPDPVPSTAASEADPTGVTAPDGRTPPTAAPPLRLRDSLRQSAEAGGEGFHPYRLSLEERQRMREQLRHHGTIEFRARP